MSVPSECRTRDDRRPVVVSRRRCSSRRGCLARGAALPHRSFGGRSRPSVRCAGSSGCSGATRSGDAVDVVGEREPVDAGDGRVHRADG